MSHRRDRIARLAAKRPATPSAEIAWREERDDRRLHRIANILADILDNARNSGGPSKP